MRTWAGPSFPRWRATIVAPPLTVNGPPSPPDPPAATRTAAAPSLNPDAAPDWDAIPEEGGCPLCEYILRGLSEPRCPECVYRFIWPELFDPALKAHPYLFEHNLRRPVRSFVRTMVGGLRPQKLWSSLRPTQPS